MLKPVVPLCVGFLPKGLAEYFAESDFLLRKPCRVSNDVLYGLLGLIAIGGTKLRTNAGTHAIS